MSILKKISGNQLVRLSSLNSVSVLTRIAGGFLASKMLATLGPAGMSLTGGLRNVLGFTDVFSILGMQTGIVKYSAEYEEDKKELSYVLSTVFVTVLVAVAFFALVLFIPAAFWSKWAFNGTAQYAWVFRVLAAALPLYTGSILLTAVLNGLGKYKRVILINIFGNTIGVTMSAVLIWFFKIEGAFLGLIFSPVVVFFLAIYPFYKKLGGFSLIRFSNFKPDMLNKLSAYSFMGIFTSLLSIAVYINLRNHISETVGMEQSGYWEGINRISSFYLMFAVTLQSVYLFPMLSKAKTDGEIKKLWHSFYKIVIPVFAFGLLVMYILRGLVIKTIFSEAFLPMESLFVWQLLGDLFKVASQILAQEILARRLIKQYFITEVMSFSIFYFAGIYLVNHFAAEGAVMAHCLTYFVYFIYMVVYFSKKIF
ncbi:O-antigen translocase [Flavobacterium sp. RHBU_3]|uniref:O-antigen translocase n=1 Tax=Flavobacterium sp. RHBU_3 TaxID=3391184 RepID=UPI003984CB4F